VDRSIRNVPREPRARSFLSADGLALLFGSLPVHLTERVLQPFSHLDHTVTPGWITLRVDQFLKSVKGSLKLATGDVLQCGVNTSESLRVSPGLIGQEFAN